MIQIAGTDYEQPMDKSVLGYDPSYFLLACAANNGIYRIGFDAIAKKAHDHAGNWIYPARVQNNATANLLLTATGGGTINLVYNGALMLSGGSQQIEVYGKTHYYPPATNEIKIMGPSVGNRTALADAWNLYASSVLYKENIVEIENAKEKCSAVRGITFTQDGVEKTGISAEDLDSLGLPGLTTKNPDGTYESVNPVGTIGLIFRAVKELTQAIANLTVRVINLEGRK